MDSITLEAAYFRARAQKFTKPPEPKEPVENYQLQEYKKRIKDLEQENMALKAANHKLSTDYKEDEQKGVKVRDVLKIVAKDYQISIRDLCSDRRTGHLINPRHIAMYLCKTMTLRSYPEIARVIGGRDHTSIMHGVRRISGQILEDEELAKRVNELRIKVASLMTPPQNIATTQPIVVSPKGDGGSVSPEPLSAVPGARNG